MLHVINMSFLFSFCLLLMLMLLFHIQIYFLFWLIFDYSSYCSAFDVRFIKIFSHPVHTSIYNKQMFVIFFYCAFRNYFNICFSSKIYFEVWCTGDSDQSICYCILNNITLHVNIFKDNFEVLSFLNSSFLILKGTWSFQKNSKTEKYKEENYYELCKLEVI